MAQVQIPLLNSPLEPDTFGNGTVFVQSFLKDRDPDDIHLAALALKEDIPIWSNDRDFEKISIPVYTTAQLLKILKRD